mgnify:CR=1 FL=1
MACPRNESGDYTVFLTAYTRRLGDNICFGIACIKTAPFACSIAIVIAWRFFFANSAAVLTFPIRMCYNSYNIYRDKLNNWSFHAKKAWIYGLFRVKTTLNQRFL